MTRGCFCLEPFSVGFVLFCFCFVLFFFSTMFTASTDKTLGIWDFETGTRIKKLKGHSSFVNSCFPSRRGPQYIVSGADDCTVKVCLVEKSF